MSGFASGVCAPTEAVDVGHSGSSTAGGSEGPGGCAVRSSVSAAVSSRSASAAASFSQAGSLPGDSRIALLIASRAVDASLHPLLPFLRASQNHVQELPRLRPRISLAGYLNFATRRHDRHGLGPIAHSATTWHIVRSVLVRGLGALGPDRLLPPQAYAESRGPRWSRIHADWPPVGIIPPVQTMRAPPPALHRPGVAPCRLCVSAAQGDETWKAVVRAGSDASRWDGLKRHGAQSEGDHPSH